VLYAIAGATLDGHKPPKEVDGEAYMPKVGATQAYEGCSDVAAGSPYFRLWSGLCMAISLSGKEGDEPHL
jgi:hypothetical protein